MLYYNRTYLVAQYKNVLNIDYKRGETYAWIHLQYITLSHKSSNRKNYLGIHWLEGKMLFPMLQITILIIFLTFEFHMTEASCDETQLSFSQNYDKGISPNGKILCFTHWSGNYKYLLFELFKFLIGIYMSLDFTSLC